jgi:hypothetical protein
MNKKILLLLLFFVASFSNENFSQTAPAPERDAQFWHETSVSFSPCEKKNCGLDFLESFAGFVSGTFRAGRNFSHPVDERIGGGFDLKFNKYVSFSPSYLYRAGQPSEGRKEYEHRVRFDLTLENKWQQFSLKNRNRVEYRIRHSRSDSVRYRNKTTLKIPVRKDDKEIFAPFVATEPFYDFSARAWTRNEFSAGIGKDFSGKFFGASRDKKIGLEFFYMLQNNRGTSFKYVNIAGVNLKIDLRK